MQRTCLINVHRGDVIDDDDNVIDSTIEKFGCHVKWSLLPAGQMVVILIRSYYFMEQLFIS